MQKNSLSFIEKFEEKISFFANNVVLSLFLIGIIGLFIRILFLHLEIPIKDDNFLYFRSAIDQITGYSSEIDAVYNNGWPFFLSLFFSIIPSNNFMDYMALQRCLTIGISVLTIIPIYYLGKHFFSKSYAMLGSAMYVFEPRIAQNSLFGITEPLYIISLTISLVLLFSKKYYLQYISFATLSCAIFIRSEGLFLLPIFFVMYFLRLGINKKSFFSFLIILFIILSILLPASIIRSEQIGNDGITGRISNSIIHITATSDGSASQIFSIAVNGIINMLKFLAWSQIPYLIFFVPVGLILFIKSRNYYEKTLILVGISALIPTIYVNAFASESDYLAVVGLTKIEKFPASSIEYIKNRTEYYWYNEADSLSDIIELGKENGSTHLVIDDNQNRPQFIKDVLINENNFPYLIKEYDSLEKGYKYRLKIYRIDYEKFNLINELR